ncbi:MAG: hypothetical protein M3N45_01345 [Actinomycetota bacterium]|nr:hypothetical protein [Actinomycetota bacterium]
MNREEIQRSFVGSGWEVCESSSPYLLVGNAGDLSILAYRSLAETEDPVFELVDRRRGTTYWVRVVPTPRLASVLLEEHGELTQRPLVGNRSL